MAAVRGDQRAVKALTKLSAAVEPRKRMRYMREVALLVRRDSLDAFRRERAPDIVAPLGRAASAAGKYWRPLAERTLEQRSKRAAWTRKSSRQRALIAARGGPGSVQMLVDTGLMRASIGQTITPNYVETGPSAFYGLEQYGGTYRIPARPFVGVNEDTVRQFSLHLWLTILGEVR